MKNKQAVILLLIANSISGFAQGITMLSIPWYFTNNLDQASFFGKLYFFTTLATLVWGTYAGTLVDKYNRKKLFLLQNIVGFSILAFSASYGFINKELPTALVGLCFVATIFIYNIHYPNLYAFAQEITKPKDYSKVTSYLEIQGQATNAIAGGIAALLISKTAISDLSFFGASFKLPFTIEPWELWEVLALDASTYLLAFAIILLIKYNPVAKRKEERGNVLEQIKTGFRFLIDKPAIFIFGSASYGIFVTILVGVYFLAPTFINKVLHESGNVYALTDMTFAIGAMLAGVFIRKIFKNTNTAFAIVLMTSFVAIFYLALSSITLTSLFIVGYFFVGICNAGTRILRVTYLFERIPNQIIGRVTSAFRIVNVALRSFFIGLFSLMFFVDNANLSYLIMSLFLLLCIAVMIKHFKTFNKVEVLND